MSSLPRVIASSVVRSAHEGESHGGVYLVDLDSGSCAQVIDWNDSSINWEGRGGERGLRGIAFYRDEVYLAASNEILVYDRAFNQLRSHRNRYLRQCHEIFIDGRRLLITSTGFDSILEFDLEKRAFVRGVCFRAFDDLGDVFELDPVSRSLVHRSSHPKNGTKSHSSSLLDKLKGVLKRNGEPVIQVNEFDPDSEDGPLPADRYHINNVFCDNGSMFFSGTGSGTLWQMSKSELKPFARIPHGTHNVRPFQTGVLLNETAGDRMAYYDRNSRLQHEFSIPRYRQAELLMCDLPEDYARQGFGRGLCLTNDGLIVGGSSPATISVYQLGVTHPIRTVNITMDVRNSIHGLEIWPF
ncbi:MAG TPA: hypothetical protein VFV34_18270 [Blastocatellia bacterium]|nr:hypothetical protein [Blastocatellia bacterium]